MNNRITDLNIQPKKMGLVNVNAAGRVRMRDLEVFDIIKRYGKELVVIKKTDKSIRLKCGMNYKYTIGARSMEWVEVIGRQGNPKVIQMDLQGNILYEYDSIIQAAVMCNLRFSGISGCLHYRQRTCGGYRWKRA